MAESTTRISELPENITMQIQHNYPVQPNPQYQPQIQQMQPVNEGMDPNNTQNTYVPLNMHPNPYGIPDQPPNGLPLPEASPQRERQSSHEITKLQYNDLMREDPLQGMPQQRLPSRDIPMNPANYQQDEQVQANFVPTVKLTSDYIREYEEASERVMKEHEEKKYREEKANTTFSELQIPLLIAVLYFIFQMPIINTFLRKYFSFLALYHSDGNFNLIGLLLKSILFGSIFYGMNSVATMISNF
jgi:hypothetical protein